MDPSNRREFFDRLGNRLNYSTLEDFYDITVDDVNANGGSALLQSYYDSSLAQVFQDNYPNHIWQVWKFSQKVRVGYWNIEGNQRDFMDELGKQLGFQQMDDWYGITSKQIVYKKGGSRLLKTFGDSPSNLVTSVYKYHQWNGIQFKTLTNQRLKLSETNPL